MSLISTVDERRRLVETQIMPSDDDERDAEEASFPVCWRESFSSELADV